MGWPKCSEDNWEAFYDRMEMRAKNHTNTEDKYEKNTKTKKNEAVTPLTAWVRDGFYFEKR